MERVRELLMSALATSRENLPVLSVPLLPSICLPANRAFEVFTVVLTTNLSIDHILNIPQSIPFTSTTAVLYSIIQSDCIKNLHPAAIISEKVAALMALALRSSKISTHS